MRKDNKVQFVFFETTLDKEPFIKRWEQYRRSDNSDVDVTVQQSEKDGLFSYIAQHRFETEEIQFVFAKESKSSRLAQERIKSTYAGGYLTIQSERLQDAGSNDRKVFVCLPDASSDLAAYKRLALPGSLNIYQAYYENCKFAYILEFFSGTKTVAHLRDELRLLHAAEIGIFKECKLVKSKQVEKKEGFYVWPTF